MGVRKTKNVWIWRENPDKSMTVWSKNQAKICKKFNYPKAKFKKAFVIHLPYWYQKQIEDLVRFLRAKGLEIFLDRWNNSIEIYTGEEV